MKRIRIKPEKHAVPLPERSGQPDGTARDGNRFGRIHAWSFHLCGKPEIAWAGGTIAVWTDSSGGWFHPVSPSADTDGKVHCRFRLWRVFTGQVAGNRTERSRIFLRDRYRFLERDISTVPVQQRQSWLMAVSIQHILSKVLRAGLSFIYAGKKRAGRKIFACREKGTGVRFARLAGYPVFSLPFRRHE